MRALLVGRPGSCIGLILLSAPGLVIDRRKTAMRKRQKKRAAQDLPGAALD
jgi:hypothetical protein